MRKKILILSACMLGFITTQMAQNGLDFDGSNDNIQTTNSGVLDTTNRTFEAWVKVSATAPSSNLCILDYGLNAVGSRNTFVVNGNRALAFISGGTNANISSSTGAVPVGQWVHVAFVLNNGTGFLYVNGTQVGTGSLTTVNTPSGNANIKIGQRVSGGSIPFNGTIDEVRIWNVARTATEISANMNSELCTYPSSLIGYYKLNQGTAGGNNSGLTNVIGEIGGTAIANNFAMTGAASNWVTGASITAITPLDLSTSIDTLSQILSSNDSSLNTRYQWYDCTNSSILVGDTNRTYSYRSAGDFAVILSNGSCIDTSACISTTFTPVVSLPGEALHFDGTNDYIQTTYSGILDSANRTFEAWVNVSASAPSSNLAIIDYGLNAVGSRNTFLVDGSRGIRFVSGGTNANISSTAGVVLVSQWTHVAFVLNNGTGFLYVNGSQVGTGSLTTVNTPSGNADVTIGQRVSGGSLPFNGIIDEVRIWDVARTQAEIMASMNTEFCGPSPGLKAHYNMNNGIAGGNNTSITKVPNSINSGDSFLTNFALTGSTSNFDTTGATLSLPVIDTSISQTGITLLANDTTVDRYQWINCSNNMILAGDTARSFTASFSGDFAVVLTKNGCTDTSMCTNILSVGLNESGFENNFYLSQNPVENDFWIINNSGVIVNTSIRSITGRLVDVKLNVRDAKIDFNLSGVKSGIYILSIEGKEGFKRNFKIIKK